MERENEMLAFLDEVIEMRSTSRADSLRDLPEVVEIREKIIALYESIQDEELKKLFFQYENLKNQKEAVLSLTMYREGLNDIVKLLQLVIKTFFRN